MITDMDTGWLYASKTGPETAFVDLTIEEPNIPVVATTALSAHTAGVFERTPGTVATYVREYGVFTGTSSIEVVDVPPDPANNVFYVENCAFVRFRLTVFQATAWAQACVFRLPAPSQRTKPMPAKTFDPKRRHTLSEYRIGDSSGDDFGTHRVLTLRRGSTLAVEALLRRSASEAAAHLGVPRRQVEIMRTRSRRPPRPDGGHVF